MSKNTMAMPRLNIMSARRVSIEISPLFENDEKLSSTREYGYNATRSGSEGKITRRVQSGAKKRPAASSTRARGPAIELEPKALALALGLDVLQHFGVLGDFLFGGSEHRQPDTLDRDAPN